MKRERLVKKKLKAATKRVTFFQGTQTLFKDLLLGDESESIQLSKETLKGQKISSSH